MLAEALLPEAGRISVWCITNQLIEAGPSVGSLLSHPLPALVGLWSQKPKADISDRLLQSTLRDPWTPATLAPLIRRPVKDSDQKLPPTIHIVVNATFNSLRSAGRYLYFEGVSILDTQVTAASIGKRSVSLTQKGTMSREIGTMYLRMSPTVVELILEEAAAPCLRRHWRSRPNGEGSWDWIFPELRTLRIRDPLFVSLQPTIPMKYRELIADLKLRSSPGVAELRQGGPVSPVTLHLEYNSRGLPSDGASTCGTRMYVGSCNRTPATLKTDI